MNLEPWPRYLLKSERAAFDAGTFRDGMAGEQGDSEDTGHYSSSDDTGEMHIPGTPGSKNPEPKHCKSTIAGPAETVGAASG